MIFTLTGRPVKRETTVAGRTLAVGIGAALRQAGKITVRCPLVGMADTMVPDSMCYDVSKHVGQLLDLVVPGELSGKKIFRNYSDDIPPAKPRASRAN